VGLRAILDCLLDGLVPPRRGVDAATGRACAPRRSGEGASEGCTLARGWPFPRRVARLQLCATSGPTWFVGPCAATSGEDGNLADTETCVLVSARAARSCRGRVRCGVAGVQVGGSGGERGGSRRKVPDPGLCEKFGIGEGRGRKGGGGAAEGLWKGGGRAVEGRRRCGGRAAGGMCVGTTKSDGRRKKNLRTEVWCAMVYVSKAAQGRRKERG